MSKPYFEDNVTLYDYDNLALEFICLKCDQMSYSKVDREWLQIACNECGEKFDMVDFLTPIELKEYKKRLYKNEEEEQKGRWQRGEL